jgi:hypothetical protein
VIAAVVVIVIVVVAVLSLAGVLSPSGGSSPGLTGAPVSYDQVAPIGARGVQNESGGPWTVVGAVGLGLTTSVTGSIAASAVVNGCTATPAPGSPSGGTLPATPTGSTPGAVALWMFVGADPATGEVLLVAADQTTSVPLFLLNGSCTGQFLELNSIAGVQVVNSTQIGVSANSAGGTTFLSQNADAIPTFVLVGSGGAHGLDDPTWVADYTTCQPGATGSGTAFIALYNANTGSPIGSPTTQMTSC